MAESAPQFETIIKKHSREKKSLIPILQDIQAQFNYLPQDALLMVSNTLKIPLIDVLSVASFYNAFSLKPRGKHVVTVCLGTACHVRGAPSILEEFKRKLNVDVEETTKDNLFTLETVNCLGACALGPIVVIDGDYYGQMKIRKVDKLIKKFRAEKRSGAE
jgi:NADH-quinone oxidoreductase subunit E